MVPIISATVRDVEVGDCRAARAAQSRVAMKGPGASFPYIRRRCGSYRFLTSRSRARRTRSVSRATPARARQRSRPVLAVTSAELCRRCSGRLRRGGRRAAVHMLAPNPRGWRWLRRRVGGRRGERRDRRRTRRAVGRPAAAGRGDGPPAVAQRRRGGGRVRRRSRPRRRRRATPPPSRLRSPTPSRSAASSRRSSRRTRRFSAS